MQKSYFYQIMMCHINCGDRGLFQSHRFYHAITQRRLNPNTEVDIRALSGTRRCTHVPCGTRNRQLTSTEKNPSKYNHENIKMHLLFFEHLPVCHYETSTRKIVYFCQILSRNSERKLMGKNIEPQGLDRKTGINSAALHLETQ